MNENNVTNSSTQQATFTNNDETVQIKKPAEASTRVPPKIPADKLSATSVKNSRNPIQLTRIENSSAASFLEGSGRAPICANITYDFMIDRNSDGDAVPVSLGHGKFAKVYLGRQFSSGNPVRNVAIKILHDYANKSAERLFKQEIDLLKEISSGHSVNVVHTLDVVFLAPMVLCSCGNIYHPLCPQGCNAPLQRDDSHYDRFPALKCPKCNYHLSARFLSEREDELFRPAAKPCCASKRGTHRSTILNFVDREAVVLELLDFNLFDFLKKRRTDIQQLIQKHQLFSKSKNLRAQKGDGWHLRTLQMVRDELEQNSLEVIFKKTILLEKIGLMVQLAEAVAWLHSEKKIIHKDLAPDNIMLCSTGLSANSGATLSGEAYSPKKSSLRGILKDIISHPSYALQVIDFGLSDRNEPSRSWYEEDEATGNTKHPFLSPEAKLRRQRIGQQLIFENDRVLIPSRLRTTIEVTDIINDIRDVDYNHALEILEIDTSSNTQNDYFYAKFRGSPPTNLDNQQFELVRQLSEAHDIYALGALFYFILTENENEVERLSNFVGTLTDRSLQLNAKALFRDDGYRKRRSAIIEPYWRDELMVVILRAMVRGRPDSFVPTRTTRGSQAARQLLESIKHIHHELQTEIMAASDLVSMKKKVAIAAIATGAIGTLLGALVAK